MSLSSADKRPRSGRPEPGEYADYAAADIAAVPGDDAVEALARLEHETRTAFRSLVDTAESGFAYAPGKWTVKQVLGHLVDDERIFAYRLLCVARGEDAELPGFDENRYVAHSEFEGRRLEDILAEYGVVRAATLGLLRGLPPSAWLRRGRVNGYECSVRGLAFHIAGHELHHLRVLRERYRPPSRATAARLDEEQDPIALFREWRREATALGAPSLAGATCLSTVEADGTPHARFVDLKEVRDDGFAFCTSHASPKAAHIEANPRVALTFWWDHVKRQVRVSGRATRITEAEADAFFRRRGREAQLASWAFEQSALLPGDVSLADRLNTVHERFGSGEVPRPPHWGGYVVAPDRIEFLNFEASRAHGRVLYERHHGRWTVSELQP